MGMSAHTPCAWRHRLPMSTRQELCMHVLCRGKPWNAKQGQQVCMSHRSKGMGLMPRAMHGEHAHYGLGTMAPRGCHMHIVSCEGTGS